MATPHLVQMGIPPPDLIGMLFASPARPSLIFRGPVGMTGAHG